MQGGCVIVVRDNPRGPKNLLKAIATLGRVASPCGLQQIPRLPRRGSLDNNSDQNTCILRTSHPRCPGSRDLPGLRSTNSTLSLSYESSFDCSKGPNLPPRLPLSDDAVLFLDTDLVSRTCAPTDEIAPSQHCVLLPPCLFRTNLSLRHRPCCWCKDVCRSKGVILIVSAGLEIRPSRAPGGNPRTVLAPRMRRYLADRQWRSFLRIPSGAMHSHVVRLEPVGIQSGGFQFQEYPSADSERLQSP